MYEGENRQLYLRQLDQIEAAPTMPLRKPRVVFKNSDRVVTGGVRTA